MKEKKIRLTNEILARYTELKNGILVMTAEQAQIREAIIERGPFSTKDWIALVSLQNRRCLAPVDIIMSALKMTEEQMMEKGLMDRISVPQVKVEAKKLGSH